MKEQQQAMIRIWKQSEMLAASGERQRWKEARDLANEIRQEADRLVYGLTLLITQEESCSKCTKI